MSGQELTTFQQASLDDRWRYAQAIAQAGDLVPKGLRDGNKMNAGKVLMAMEQAVTLGFSPIVGVNHINVIDGKVSLPPSLMQAAVRRAGHKLRVTMEGTVEGGDLKATATLIREDDPEYPFTATWTPHRAARAGLCEYIQEGGQWRVIAMSKDRGYGSSALPWQSYTEAMLKARAISEVCMEGATDVLLGTYTPEELGASVDASGVVIDVEPVGQPQNAAQDAQGQPQDAAEVVPATSGPQEAPQAVLGDSGADSDPAAFDQWAEVIREADNLNTLRAVWEDAQRHGVLGMTGADGATLKDLMAQRGNVLKAAAEAPAAAEADDSEAGEQDGQE